MDVLDTPTRINEVALKVHREVNGVFAVDRVTCPTRHADQARLQAEVLALRRRIQVLERQIKRVKWGPGDRMVLAALSRRIPRSGWAALLVKPETVLGWHRALVRKKWAAYRGRPRRASTSIASTTTTSARIGAAT